MQGPNKQPLLNRWHLRRPWQTSTSNCEREPVVRRIQSVRDTFTIRNIKTITATTRETQLRTDIKNRNTEESGSNTAMRFNQCLSPIINHPNQPPTFWGPQFCLASDHSRQLDSVLAAWDWTRDSPIECM